MLCVLISFHVSTSDVLCAQSFWGRLSGKYGNKFYWQEKGEAESILNAVRHAAQLHACPCEALASVCPKKMAILCLPAFHVSGVCH
jgi:hypothetical protein